MAVKVATDAGAPLFAHIATGFGTCRSEVAPPSCGQPWGIPRELGSSSSPSLEMPAPAEALPGSLHGNHSKAQFEIVESALASFAAHCSARAQPPSPVTPPRSRRHSEVPSPFEASPCTEEQAPEVEATAAKVRRLEKPKLMLPLPLRQSVADPGSPAHDVDLLPALPAKSAAADQGFPGLKSRRAAGARSGRQLPSRLQALDDLTVLPRDVYDRMLKLGDTARGSLGYGQHIKLFRPDGAPVLCRAV